MQPEGIRQRLRLAEWAGVAALLIAALSVRTRDLDATFGRGFEGARESGYTIAAVNYERFGLARTRGYPAFVLDTGELDPETLDHADAMVGTNVPPTSFVLGWFSLKVLGPEGWDSAWREARAPSGVELALRLPFLLAHLFGLWAFWWWLRQAGGAGTAMVGLALYAASPAAIHHAALPGPEALALPCVFLAYGAYALHARTPRRRGLLALGVASFGAAGVAGAAAWLLAPLPLHALLTGPRRRALRVLVACGAGAALAIAAHAVLSDPFEPRLPEATVTVSDEISEFLHALASPRLSVAERLARSTEELPWAIGWPVLVAAVLGLLVRAARDVSSALDERLSRLEVGGSTEGRLDLVVPFSLGVLACSIATVPPHQGPGSLWTPLLFVPAACAAAAFLLQQFAVPMFRLRAGLAPIVLVVATLASPGLIELGARRHRDRAPGPHDPGGSPTGVVTPLPATTATELAAVVPSGSVGVVPAEIGFTAAHSFYAWRLLLSLPGPPAAGIPIFSPSPVLDEARQRYVLPPWWRGGDEEFDRALEALGSPAAEVDGWRAWSL